jgi:hypothetical protein
MKTIIHQLKIAWGFASGALLASMACMYLSERYWLCFVLFFSSIFAFYFAIREHDKYGKKVKE